MKKTSLCVLVCSLLSGASAFAGEPLELVLGDSLEKPAVLPLTLTAPNASETVLIKTTKQRTVQFYVYGLGARVQANGAIVRPDAPLSAKVYGRPGAATLVVTDETTAAATARDVYSVPPTFAKLEERQLDLYLLAMNHKNPFHDPHGHDAALLAGELFRTIDKRLVVYATAPAPQYRREDRVGEWRAWDCGFDVGEPLLILRVHGWGNSQTAKLLRATGQSCDLRAPLVNHVSPTPPAQLVLPPPTLPAINQSLNRWKDEEFIPLADTNPRIAKYKATKEAAQKCSDALWKKLDPDASANRYDVVTYSGGKVKKVESLTEKNQRQVDATCKLQPIFKERDAIRVSLAATYRKDTEARLAAIAAYLQP